MIAATQMSDSATKKEMSPSFEASGIDDRSCDRMYLINICSVDDEVKKNVKVMSGRLTGR